MEELYDYLSVYLLPLTLNKMKKLILLLLFIPLVFSCSSEEDGDMKLVIENNLNNSSSFNSTQH